MPAAWMMEQVPEERRSARHSGRPADDEASALGELLNVFWRRNRLIMLCVVVLTTPALLVGLSRAPEYTATAAVMIAPRESRVVDIEQVLQGLSTDSGTIQTQIEVVRSRDNIVRTIEELRLLDDPELVGRREETKARQHIYDGALWSNLLGALAAWIPAEWLVATGYTDEVTADEAATDSAKALLEQAIRSFAGRLEVIQTGSSHVLSVSYMSEDPVKAAAVANWLASAYVAAQTEEKREATSKANVWLADRLNDLRSQVVAAEREVARFRADNELVIAKGTSLSDEQLADLNRQLIELRVQKAALESSLRLIGEIRASGEDLGAVAEVQSSPLITSLRQQQALLMRLEAELAANYGPLHPRMQELKEEKANLIAGIEGEVDRIARRVENELVVINTREEKLDEALNAAKSGSSLLSQAEVQLRALERDAEAKRALYESFLARLQQTREQQQLVEPDARVIFPAQVPTRPSTLPPTVFAAVGFTISGMFGCLLALLWEQLDRRLRSRRQIEELLQIPCLGVVGKVSRRDRQRGLHRYLRAKPRSPYAEGIRALYAVTFLGEQEARPRAVLVTSALPREGKTSVAASLAVYAAKLGRSSLLIDLDLRRPKIADEFGLHPECGIGDVVRGDARLEQVLVRDQTTGVDILPAGLIAADPTPILTAASLHSLLGELRLRYDCIMIDSPPLLGVTDTQILAPHADVVMFLVRWGWTRQDAALAGLGLLRRASARLAGAVLSQVDLKKQARYRYGDAEQYIGQYRHYYAD